MRNINLKRVLLAATAALTIGAAAQAADISGAGATFPYPVYAKWADSYKKETGIGLNYQSIGSGGGIKQIQAKTVTFGATDMPLKVEQLEKDVGQSLRRETQRLLQAFEVVSNDDRAEHCRNMHDLSRRGLEIFIAHRRIRGAKIYRLFLELLDAAARADRLVIDLNVGMNFSVLTQPFLI